MWMVLKCWEIKYPLPSLGFWIKFSFFKPCWNSLLESSTYFAFKSHLVTVYWILNWHIHSIIRVFVRCMIHIYIYLLFHCVRSISTCISVSHDDDEHLKLVLALSSAFCNMNQPHSSSVICVLGLQSVIVALLKLFSFSSVYIIL